MAKTIRESFFIDGFKIDVVVSGRFDGTVKSWVSYWNKGVGNPLYYNNNIMSFETKDSGKRAEFDSGMVRDTDEGKPRYELIYQPTLQDYLAEVCEQEGNPELVLSCKQLYTALVDWVNDPNICSGGLIIHQFVRYDIRTGVCFDWKEFTKRWAQLMARGAEKYDAHNWKKAEGEEELERFKGSALRHAMQWCNGEQDEDHLAALAFNIAGIEYLRNEKL